MKAIFERLIACLLVFAIGVASPIIAVAQTPDATAAPATANAAAPPPSPNDPWPRVVTSQGATISVYQPQVESWTGNKLTARSAVKVKLPGKTATDYGVVWYLAQTEVDKVNRVVTLENVAVTKQSFPTIANNGQAYSSAFLSDTPKLRTVPLDLLEAELAVTNAASEQKTYPLQNDPPQIIFSITPAVLALVDGTPVLRPSADKLQKVINTRAMILFDPSKSKYYVALMDGWMEADRIDGMYSPAKRAPTKDMEKILQAAQSDGQNQPLGNPQESLKEAEEDGQVPTIFIMTKPAELVVTQGVPVYAAIPGTSLQYVSNTGSDVFQDTSNQNLLFVDRGAVVPVEHVANGRQLDIRRGKRFAGGFCQDSVVQSEGQRAGFGAGNAAGERSDYRELDSADGDDYAFGSQAECDLRWRAGLPDDPGY